VTKDAAKAAGCATAKFLHFKPGTSLGADLEPFAVAVGSEEDAVFHAGIHVLSEDGLQVDASGSIDKLRRARIFKPILRRPHGVGFDPSRARAARRGEDGLLSAGAGGVTAAAEGATSSRVVGLQCDRLRWCLWRCELAPPLPGL
jgi:hypothetical protein